MALTDTMDDTGWNHAINAIRTALFFQNSMIYFDLDLSLAVVYRLTSSLMKT